MDRTVSSIKALQKKYIKFINSTKNISYEELSKKFGIDIENIKEICETKSEYIDQNNGKINDVDKINGLIEMYKFTKDEIKDDVAANILKIEIINEINSFVINKSNNNVKNKLKTIDVNTNDEKYLEEKKIKIKIRVIKDKEGNIIRKERIE